MSYRINLNEIPDAGRSYEFDRQTGELNAILADLIQDQAYKVELFIRPMGNAFELSGSIETQIPEVCSKCAYDLQIAVQRRFKEFLMEEQDDSHRKSQSVHGNQSVDFSNEGASVAWYKGNQFEAGEFIHETLALSVPFYPICGTPDCEARQETNKQILAEKGVRLIKEGEREGHPGFSILKDLKIKGFGEN
jgi:uncharacterized protein